MAEYVLNMEAYMEERYYLTVTHIDSYAGCGMFRPGMILRMKKDHENPYDDEAIAVYGNRDAKYGYVANSTHSVCRGTHSAGYFQHLFGEEAQCIVLFVADDLAIAELIQESEK